MNKESDWFNLGKNNIWYPYTQMQIADAPIKVKKTDKCNIILEDGTSLIDGISSWWSTCHGYNHPYIIKKMKEQLDQMPHVMFAGTAHEQAYILANRLSKLTGLEKVFLTDSGSTAVETALKISAQYWVNKNVKNRNKFISFKHGYHGDTMGCMSLCDPDDGMHKILNNYMPKQYSIKIPADEYEFFEFKELLHGVKNNVAAVIIEPLVQGAGGMKFHSPDILAEIYNICKENEILFIADEIMTGFGRTGNMFACDEAAITPDIMCVGKGLTGGNMTLATTLVKEEIFETFLSDRLDTALMSGPTFMANPLACSAANASLDLFEQEDRLKQVANIEKQLYADLEKCRHLHKVASIRIKGAIAAISLHDTSWDEMFEFRRYFISKGIWLRPFADIIYIMPPFIITSDELSKITDSVYQLLKK